MQLALVTVLALGHVMPLALVLLVGMPLWNPGVTLCQLAVVEALPLGVGDPYQVAHLRAFVCYQALHYHRCCAINMLYAIAPVCCHAWNSQKIAATSIPGVAIQEVQFVDIVCVVMLQGLLMLLVLSTDGVLTTHTHLQLVMTHMQ